MSASTGRSDTEGGAPERSSASLSGDRDDSMAVDTAIEDVVLEDSSGYAANDVVMTDRCNGAADAHLNGDDTRADIQPQTAIGYVFPNLVAADHAHGCTRLHENMCSYVGIS